MHPDHPADRGRQLARVAAGLLLALAACTFWGLATLDGLDPWTFFVLFVAPTVAIVAAAALVLLRPEPRVLLGGAAAGAFGAVGWATTLLGGHTGIAVALVATGLGGAAAVAAVLANTVRHEGPR